MAQEKHQDMRPEKRIVISLIGWIFDLIIEAVRKKKESKQ